jgi:hypothetical protein
MKRNLVLAALFMGFISACSSGNTPSGVTAAAPSPANSVDADGFLWGTEGNVNIADAANLAPASAAVCDAINGTLRTRYVKFRISRAFFSTSDNGLTFSHTYCLPSASNCADAFDM